MRQEKLWPCGVDWELPARQKYPAAHFPSSCPCLEQRGQSEFIYKVLLTIWCRSRASIDAMNSVKSATKNKNFLYWYETENRPIFSTYKNMQITRASQALLSSNSVNMDKLLQMKLWMTFHWVGLSGLLPHFHKCYPLSPSDASLYRDNDVRLLWDASQNSQIQHLCNQKLYLRLYFFPWMTELW